MPSTFARTVTTSSGTTTTPCPSLEHRFVEVGFRWRKHPSILELATQRVIGEIVKKCEKCGLVATAQEPYLPEKPRVYEFRRRARDVFGWSL